MEIIGWLLFGLIVGAIAKLLMPGNDPGGWIATMLLGVGGAVVGGYVGRVLFNESYTAGWVMSIIGAILLLVVYRAIMGSRRRVV